MPQFYFLILSFSAAITQYAFPKETQQGWQLLFNGKDLVAGILIWKKLPGKAWQVQDGTIFLNKNNKSVYNDYADLVTDDEFENFDLKVGMENGAMRQ